MQLSKKEYARKRIYNGSSVRIENSSRMMPNSYPCDGIFNQHLTTIKDSYILAWDRKPLATKVCFLIW